MTDYRAPTTPGDALRKLATDFRARERAARNEARTLIAQADVYLAAADDADAAAARYDKWQQSTEEAAS